MTVFLGGPNSALLILGGSCPAISSGLQVALAICLFHFLCTHGGLVGLGTWCGIIPWCFSGIGTEVRAIAGVLLFFLGSRLPWLGQMIHLWHSPRGVTRHLDSDYGD